MLCMIRVCKNKKRRRSTSGHLSTKSLSRPADKPLVNRLFCSRIRSTYDFACSCFWGEVQAMCPRCLGGCEGRSSSGRTVLSASSPDRPHPAASLCAPTRLARGMFGFWIRQILGYALHEKGLQRQKGVVPLFGSQEQSALLVPLINRW